MSDKPSVSDNALTAICIGLTVAGYGLATLIKFIASVL